MKLLEATARALEASAAVANAPPAATAWQNAERREDARRRLETARSGLRSALADNPGNFQLSAGLGAVEARLGHSEAAIGLLEEAARLQPAALDNLYTLADAYREADRMEDALRVIAEIHRMDPDFLPAYMWMSGYHARRDEYGHAVGWMKALARRTASDPALHRDVVSRLATLSAAMRERGQEPLVVLERRADPAYVP
jgi:tetratricopeptide (TPR) repeat protein